MTYQELFDKLTPEQMKQQVVIFVDDEETGRLDISVYVSEEDMYWEHTDLYGNLEDVMQQAKDDDMELQDLLDDLTIVPKGTVTLHIEE